MFRKDEFYCCFRYCESKKIGGNAIIYDPVSKKIYHDDINCAERERILERPLSNDLDGGLLLLSKKEASKKLKNGELINGSPITKI